MAPVQRVFDKAEKDRARELGDAQQQLAAAETKLAELRTYQGEYLGAFRRRAESGTSIRALRDFQAFLARLDQALRQQEQLVEKAREQASGSRRNWQGAAQKVKALGAVVQRWERAEDLAGEKRDQKDSDERALHSAARARGNGERS